MLSDGRARAPLPSVLVTGGCGYVGSVLVDKLAAAGHRVTAYDLMIYGRGDDRAGVTFVQGDIRDRDTLRAAMHGCDAVVHLAFACNDPQYELAPAIGRSINLDGFAVVLEEATRAGVGRFIFASSTSVYGQAAGLCSESTPPHPLTPYAEHKSICERWLRETAAPMTRIILRPATVMGVSRRQRFDLLVNGMIARAFFERRVEVRNLGAVRPVLHIDDLAEVYARMLLAPREAVGEVVFNVAAEPRTTLEHARAVCEELPAELVVVEGAGADRRSYDVSSERLARAIDLRPQRSVRDTARELAACFAAGRFSDALTADAYYNLRVQKRVWR